jgi:hypothetical protein
MGLARHVSALAATLAFAIGFSGCTTTSASKQNALTIQWSDGSSQVLTKCSQNGDTLEISNDTSTDNVNFAEIQIEGPGPGLGPLPSSNLQLFEAGAESQIGYADGGIAPTSGELVFSNSGLPEPTFLGDLYYNATANSLVFPKSSVKPSAAVTGNIICDAGGAENQK